MNDRQAWLTLNELTVQHTLDILAAILPFDGSELPKLDRTTSLPFNADTAWNICADAMVARYPSLAEEIEAVRAHCVRDLDPDVSNTTAPFADYCSLTGLDIVSCRYQQRPSDLLTLAHEFAHVVQNYCSRLHSSQDGGSLAAPVAREACAFLGEMNLLDSLRATESPLFDVLLAAYRADDHLYFALDAADLMDSLTDTKSRAYDYRWNYPIARALARVVRADDNRSFEAALFTGGSDAAGSLAQFAQRRLRAGSPLRSIVKSRAQGELLTGYEALGMVAMLDMATAGERASQSIDEYFDRWCILSREHEVLINCDSVNRPSAYAFRSRSVNGGALAHEQYEPFGDHHKLQQSFCEMPADVSLFVCSPSEAQDEQRIG